MEMKCDKQERKADNLTAICDPALQEVSNSHSFMDLYNLLQGYFSICVKNTKQNKHKLFGF
jgi:hypothetical protein